MAVGAPQSLPLEGKVAAEGRRMRCFFGTVKTVPYKRLLVEGDSRSRPRDVEDAVPYEFSRYS